jgi:hypothetical protein
MPLAATSSDWRKTALPRTLLEGFQVLEYLRAYGIGRLFFTASTQI